MFIFLFIFAIISLFVCLLFLVVGVFKIQNTPLSHKYEDIKHKIVNFQHGSEIIRGNVCKKRGGILSPMEYQVLLSNNSFLWVYAEDLIT